MLRTIVAGVSVLALAGPALAAAAPSGLIGDHAVLQRGKPIVVRDLGGSDAPNDAVRAREIAAAADGAGTAPDA
jgi:sialate O-acetylesterase